MPTPEFPITISREELEAILPASVLFLTGLILLIVDPMLRARDEKEGGDHAPKSHLGLIGAGGALLALAALGLGGKLIGGAGPSMNLFAGALGDDAFGEFAAALIIAAVFLVSLASGGYLAAQGYNRGEFYALSFFGAGAMVLLAQATNLLSIFVAVETLSLSVYVLAGFFRGRALGGEGAFKYFVMGAFSSGFLLFGMAFLYGASGSLELSSYAGADVDSVLLRTGVLFAFIGFAFKVGAVPFHSWVPDAYQGAPALAAGWMAVAVKVASFAALIRLVVAASAGPAGGQLANMVAAVAVVTMIMGNLAALNQTNLKRMLAYSGIAHTGYLLIPVYLLMTRPPELAADASPIGASALFYLGGYTLMTLGAFTVIAIVSRGNEDREELESFRGLAQRHPMVALAMTISLVSLAGIPLTGGFIGKWMVFAEAIQANVLYLAVIGILASLISVYYYIRPVVAMYFHDEETPISQVDASWGLSFTLIITTVGTLFLGIMPQALVNLSQVSIKSLG